MPKLEVGRENSGAIELHYEDHGAGKPVVLIHGWPLSGRSWEKQMGPLVAAGHRVIAYDRRGSGESSKPWGGYEYDTLTADLHQLMTKLDLRDATLVGFSMGGGEVARYVAKHGKERVSRAVFVAAIPPFLLKTADNPDGVERAVFDGIQQGLLADRPGFLAGFLANYFNLDELGGTRMSEDALRANWTVAISASAKATHDCVAAWPTDFRADLAKFDLPTLVVHGDADRIVPLAISGQKTAAAIPGSKLVVVPGAPHGLAWTHADELNKALLAFLGAKAMAGAS
jgi:pimeloyl-ACP methyl ester carboxylesterase